MRQFAPTARQERGLAGLAEGQRSGRPGRLSQAQLEEVDRVLRQTPRDFGWPIVEATLDPGYSRRTFASIYFEGIHGRLARPGDILRYEDVVGFFSDTKAEVESIQEAWARRLPECPCPFKFEGGKMLIHRCDDRWTCDPLSDPAAVWSLIEDDAFGRNKLRLGAHPADESLVPTIEAVVFIESEDGKLQEPYVGPSHHRALGVRELARATDAGSVSPLPTLPGARVTILPQQPNR